MPRTPASAWATAPTREELLAALRRSLACMDSLSVELQQRRPVEAVEAWELLRREDLAQRQASAA